MGISMFSSREDNDIFHPLENGVEALALVESRHATDVPVVIIGGGPAGLLQAHLLSHLGVKSLVVERYPERLGAPKAHALSPRSLEICRQAGLDVKRIRNLGTKRADAFWVNFLTNLSGEQVGVLPYERMDPEVLEDTPEMIHNIPQPVFEQFVTEYLAKDSNVDIRKGVSFVSLVQDGARVVTTVEERATGHRFQIKSRYLIGCDGARSKVKNFLKIKSEGEDSYETMMTIHFNANLRAIVGNRVGMLHWIMDPQASGFIIAYDLSGNAVLISNFDADKHPIETWNESLCRRVLISALGREVAFEIHSYRPWLLSRKVANSYRAGNVFLAGDAAHSFPPTGGLGLNSGLADVHNLAYKIAAVHHGYASGSILDTYQSERRPVAEVNSRQSVKNGKKIFGLLKTLGMAGTSDVDEARRNLYTTIHDPSKKQMIDEGIEGQREHFDNLELHIGYVYGSTEIPPHASHYTPKFVAGARLPHTWIRIKDHAAIKALPPVNVSYVAEFSEADIALRKYSTLDLCDMDAFTLLVGSEEAWAERIHEVKARCVDSGGKVNVYYFGRDFDVVPDMASGEAWAASAGMKSGGGLLVRPDQHILLPLNNETSAGEINEALEGHLGSLDVPGGGSCGVN